MDAAAIGQATVSKMTLNQETICQWIARQIAVGQMTIDKMANRLMTIGQRTTVKGQKTISRTTKGQMKMGLMTICQILLNRLTDS